jgi:hypothetical protein
MYLFCSCPKVPTACAATAALHFLSINDEKSEKIHQSLLQVFMLHCEETRPNMPKVTHSIPLPTTDFGELFATDM